MSDKLPPSNLEAERGYIACVLRDAFEVLTKNPIPPESFYDLRNLAVYEACVNLYEQGKTVDLITVSAALRAKGTLENTGGISGLSELADACASAASHSTFSESVLECWQRRKLIHLHAEGQRLAYDNESSVQSLVSKAQESIEAIACVSIQDSSKSYDCRLVIQSLSDDIDARLQRRGKLSGIPTGIGQLDKYTDGYQKGDFVIVGARPNDGKSSYAALAADNTCWHGIPTEVITLEMSPASFFRRMCALRGHIPIAEMKSTELNQANFEKLSVLFGQYTKKPFRIYDGRGGMSGKEIRYYMRKSARQHGTRMFIIEGFIQDIQPDGRHESRTQELQQISRDLKAGAEEAGGVCIALAQLNREKDKEKGRAPIIRDLGDSCGMERKADLILLLQRKYSDEDPQGRQAAIHIAKQRDGGKEYIPMVFIPELAKWVEPAKISDQDVP